MAPAIDLVIGSFARHAPPETLLVFKDHPLDPGLRNWRRLTRGLARRHGVAERVLHIPRGPVERLLENARGLVTINSTTGFLALSFGLPVVALGTAIFDLPQLTFQGGIDRFWREAGPPDPATFDAFRRVVAERSQVNGGFFSGEGLAMAVAGTLARLEQRPARVRVRVPTTRAAPASPATIAAAPAALAGD